MRIRRQGLGMHRPRGRHDPELVATVRQLAAAGLHDGQIAVRLRAFGSHIVTRHQVQYVLAYCAGAVTVILLDRARPASTSPSYDERTWADAAEVLDPPSEYERT